MVKRERIGLKKVGKPMTTDQKEKTNEFSPNTYNLFIYFSL